MQAHGSAPRAEETRAQAPGSDELLRQGPECLQQLFACHRRMRACPSEGAVCGLAFDNTPSSVLLPALGNPTWHHMAAGQS
eukprot:scaffold3720_cov401-Prasinococcus_capsulatus_cf.AAC.4